MLAAVAVAADTEVPDLAHAYLAISDVGGARSTLAEAERTVRRRPRLGTLITGLDGVRGQLADASETLTGPSALTPAELRLELAHPVQGDGTQRGEGRVVELHLVGMAVEKLLEARLADKAAAGIQISTTISQVLYGLMTSRPTGPAAGWLKRSVTRGLKGLGAAPCKARPGRGGRSIVYARPFTNGVIRERPMRAIWNVFKRKLMTI